MLFNSTDLLLLSISLKVEEATIVSGNTDLVLVLVYLNPA